MVMHTLCSIAHNNFFACDTQQLKGDKRRALSNVLKAICNNFFLGCFVDS